MTCIPGSTDFDEANSIEAVFAAPDGTIYIRPDLSDDGYLAFGPDGKRIGRVELGGTRVAFNRLTKERWAAEDADNGTVRLRRYSADGKRALEVERRRPDGGFFTRMCALACAPDGSIGVLDDDNELCFFSSTGEPQRQIKVAETKDQVANRMEISRRWIVISDWSQRVILVSLADGKSSVFTIPDPDEDTGMWTVALSPDEKEIWALESEPAVLHRFTLPK